MKSNIRTFSLVSMLLMLCVSFLISHAEVADKLLVFPPERDYSKCKLESVDWLRNLLHLPVDVDSSEKLSLAIKASIEKGGVFEGKTAKQLVDTLLDSPFSIARRNDRTIQISFNKKNASIFGGPIEESGTRYGLSAIWVFNSTGTSERAFGGGESIYSFGQCELFEGHSPDINVTNSQFAERVRLASKLLGLPLGVDNCEDLKAVSAQLVRERLTQKNLLTQIGRALDFDQIGDIRCFFEVEATTFVMVLTDPKASGVSLGIKMHFDSAGMLDDINVRLIKLD